MANDPTTYFLTRRMQTTNLEITCTCNCEYTCPIYFLTRTTQRQNLEINYKYSNKIYSEY